MSKKQSVQDTYKKVTQIQHVLLRPDTYIGSIQMTEQSQWVLNEEENKFEYKKIKYIPGLYKIFDEILVNAADNYQRDHRMTKIDVKINEKSGQITIMNDGKSIPVQIHRQHKIYVAELIFGQLLTSSNYQDKNKKVTGGRNGYGAKLANIFSTNFSVETADASSRKLLKIEWKKNMSQMSTPEIIGYQGKDYTKISFTPDFEKFQLKKMTSDIINHFKKRVYDMAGILKCSVYLNGEFLNINTFQEYATMYIKNSENQELIYDSSSDSQRWEVIVTKSQGQFQQISFVNGIATTSGGTHITNICDQIVQQILPHLMKKVKDIQIKPFQIKSHIRIFVKCLIQNPSFNSQTKDCLNSPPASFGSTYEVSQKLIKGMLKAGIADNILNQVRSKENNKIDKQLKKIKNANFRLVIPKLQDANLAGRSTQCTLILTEGDSAKALAMSGIETLGRDNYGVYPLRGKVLNVNGMTFKQVMQHFQLSSIVKILGLSFGKKYTKTDQLRYSSVMIMADQDIDGSHIKGLVLNFLHTFWPSLCEIKGFLKQFITPIIRCKRGNEKIDFFSQIDYQFWRVNSTTDWKIKYYKGLGTSTSVEAQQYFSNLDKHQISFIYKIEDKQYFDLAFAKKNADNRKKWLQEFDRNEKINFAQKELKVEDFFNKQFRNFSISDNIRSIPSIVDGFKPSQRKILFACFKRNLKNQIKVAQLAGYIAQHSAYHHGQASLCSTLISMAQNYVGSNNINLLQPIGQFGTRYMCGKDNASPRYIFTCLNNLTRYLFPQADDHVVQYQHEQNMMIQPIYYFPILPLILINGCEGIGTGWSTNVHPHKVEDVLHAIRARIKGQSKFINIGWQGFNGEVKLEKQGQFSVSGAFNIEGDVVTISQIPIGKSIRDYKTFLQQKVKSLENIDPELEDIKEYHVGDKVEFVITFIEDKQPDKYEMAKYLKLQSKMQQTNMTLFNADQKIKKYESIADIVEDFYNQRLKAYTKRKKYLVSKFAREIEILEAKITFINAVMVGKYKMMNTRESWIRQLIVDRYKKFNELIKIQSTKLMYQEEESEENGNKDYNYLLNLPIWSFCQEKIVQLQGNLNEAREGFKYFKNVKEEDMWIKDLDEFQKAWTNYVNGKQVKIKQNHKNQFKGASNRRRRPQLQIQDQMVELQPKSKSNGKKSKKNKNVNLIEEQLGNDPELAKFYEGRKRNKTEKEDWFSYEPVQIQPAQQEDRISSLLSKYLPKSQDNNSGGQSLANRIRNRVQNNDQLFTGALNKLNEQMEENMSEDNNPESQQKDSKKMQAQPSGEKEDVEEQDDILNDLKYLS